MSNLNGLEDDGSPDDQEPGRVYTRANVSIEECPSNRSPMLAPSYSAPGELSDCGRVIPRRRTDFTHTEGMA